MRFFIVDDDLNVIRILKKIIEDKMLGTVVGEALDGKRGVEKIKANIPDIVLMDLLMPEMDGLKVIKELKKQLPTIEFIMVSQVSSKKMVEKAYKYGVEYYIYKPINAIEVETIIRKVVDRIEINRSISKMQKIFNNYSEKKTIRFGNACEKCINNVLTELGIIGERGSENITDLAKYVIRNNINLNNMTIRELCENFTDNPKSMEQRIRRAINIAMSNIANLGLEDYMNDVFTKYSNTLFNFEQVRKEMEFIRGKGKKGGSVNSKGFLAGLIHYCENIND